MRTCRDPHHRPTPAERARAEQRARAAIEAQRGTPFSDEEWAIARKNLLEFFLVLRDWEKKR